MFLNGYVWTQMVARLNHYRSFLSPLRQLASSLTFSFVMAVKFARTSAAKTAAAEGYLGEPAGTCRHIVAGEAGADNEASWG